MFDLFDECAQRHSFDDVATDASTFTPSRIEAFEPDRDSFYPKHDDLRAQITEAIATLSTIEHIDFHAVGVAAVAANE